MRDEGNATVYRAVRLEDQQPLTLKVLDPERCRPRDIERLKNELEMGGLLKGLATVEPLALSTFNGLPALEVAPFAGEPLERLVGTPMALEPFLRLALRITAALAAVHAGGVIHKDIKPANILFDAGSGEIRVTGFGIAARTRTAGEQPPSPSVRLIEGTLPYVSPEQTGRMNRAVDNRSDLYSLGVTFYQLLTGRLPFAANDPIGWVHGHLALKPRPPNGLRPELPAVLSEIVLKLLAKVPDRRYQTAAGLERDLERCLGQWRETGRIMPFPLGEHDVSDRFLIPQKLYGRAAERAALTDAFARVAGTGTPELVLVSGYPGIGKSAVVQELHRPIVDRDGLFIAGKFELYKRNIPYFAVIQAFREVVLDILAESEARIATWQQRIVPALGKNGQLIIDLIPQVGLVIGPQPPVPELPPTEAETRLRLVFRRFVGAFAAEEHPLVLFLDDLQWADAASLKLLADLTTNNDARHVLVIGAYRDNEVDVSHPLLRTLDTVRAGGAVVHDIVLAPLSEADIGQIVAATVHCSATQAAPLTGLVRDKTGGNPFFAIHFLTALHQKGLIWFDGAAGRWRWDVQRIGAQGYTDNVVDLMVGKLRELPEATQEALKMAAAIGATVDAETLAIVMHRDAGPALRAALEEELLLRLDGSYRFAHDRVQEAAYSLTPEHERAARHLQIGRLLLERTPPEELDEKSFELANQLNRGAALITVPAERECVAALNLAAGKRARGATAYASALQYFAAGLALLPDDRWERLYELSFALELRCAECEYLTGATEMAEKRLAMLMRRGRDLSDAAAVSCIRVALYTTLGRGDQAVAACLEHLGRVGICWSAHPSDEDVEREYAELRRTLQDRPIEALIDLPRVTDPLWCGALDVLTATQVAAYFTDENLHCLMVARGVNLSLRHGNGDASSMSYVGLAVVLGPRFRDYRAAFRFGKLAFDLIERHGPLRFKARIYHTFGSLVNTWARHVRASVALLRRAFEAAQETGDLLFGANCSNHLVALLLIEGDALGNVQREAENGLEFVKKVRYGFGHILVTLRQLIRMLRGLTPDFGCLNDNQFDERELERLLEADPQLKISAFTYWVRKLQARYFAASYAPALDAAAEAQRYAWTAMSHPEMAELHFYRALALAAQVDLASPDEARSLRDQLGVDQQQLDIWAENCPDNFGNRAALVAAELARIDGEKDKAAELYEHAIRAARDHGFMQNEAIAYETAARYYRARGFTQFADIYVREAYDRYLRWGADGKARQLERLYPFLIERPRLASAATVGLRPEQLDLISVVKASQTISGVILRDELLRTLLQVLLEQGGARRALVILARESELTVVAEATADDPVAHVEPTAVTAARAPVSILSYVRRTHDRVLLDDALADAGRFVNDDYFAGACPRSVLCLPVRRQAEVVALLYLENDLAPGAFTPERLVALELLAAQAAISLENALFVEGERAGRAQAEAAGRRALLLGEATALMSSTFDYEGVFSQLTGLCVRWLADWAIIDLMVGGESVRLAGAHRDPQKEPLLQELATRYPARVGSNAPAALVFRSGAPLHLADIGDEQLRALTVDDDQAELITRLGTRSGIVVPLIARDIRLGALTLGAASPRRFAEADVELVAEMGRRVALAIDNAHLLRETQRAVTLRDEFLSVAAHELRTPITSLKLAVESLLHATDMAQPVSAERLDGALRRVLRKTERLRHLSTELLDVTRIEQGKLEIQPSKVELGALVRDVVEHFELELSSARCAVSIDCPAPVVGIWDASRLDQVLTNLLSNAVKFGAGKPIEIGVRRRDGVAELVIRDHGIGIDPARLPYVFERFERAVSWAHYGGLGLGLYIAHWIVNAHGGTIGVESRLGEGCTFIVELPAEALPPAYSEASAT